MNRSLMLVLLTFLIVQNVIAMDENGSKKLSPQEQALFSAIDEGDAKKVASLIAAKVDIDCIHPIKELSFTTPLKQAAFQGAFEIVSLLLESGADDSKQGFYLQGDQESFMPALAKKELNKTYKAYVEKALQKIKQVWPAMPHAIVALIGSKLWVTDEDRALVSAVNSGKHEQAEQLLRNGADPNFLSYQGPSLCVAAFSYLGNSSEGQMNKERLKMMELLLKYGVNPDQRMISKFQVLYFLADQNAFRQVKLLLEHNADTAIVDPQKKVFRDYAKLQPRVMEVYENHLKNILGQVSVLEKIFNKDLVKIVADYVA